MNTPADAVRYLLPSLLEEREALKKELQACSEEQRTLYEQLGRPGKAWLRNQRLNSHPPPLLARYFEVMDRIPAIHQRLSVLKNEFRQQTDESFPTLFIRAAKNMLSPEQFARIQDYARLLMRELQDQVYPEPLP